MTFHLQPVIDLMHELYSQPVSMERFNKYIALLEGGTKGDMSLPIGGFNPMAKQHVLQKLSELRALHAERLMSEALSDICAALRNELPDEAIKVVLNLADDAAGGWTNRYTTDFDSKFKLNALASRRFCTPFFWTSEAYTQELIISRTKEYACRTGYWMQHGRLRTLADHVKQEAYVAAMTSRTAPEAGNDAELYAWFYKKHAESEDYSLIFYFFYGEAASRSLEYPGYGLSEGFTGFDYACLCGRL